MRTLGFAKRALSYFYLVLGATILLPQVGFPDNVDHFIEDSDIGVAQKPWGKGPLDLRENYVS